MRIHKYKDFIYLKESNENSGIAMVGDSLVSSFIVLMKELITYNNNQPGGLSKGGWGSDDLYEASKNYNQIHPEIKVLFVKIGDNDIYKKNIAEKYAPLIKTELTRIFPNARLVMVRGGWGWGGLGKFKSTTEPKELTEYYQVWQMNGFEITQTTHGYSQKHHDASNPMLKAQVEELRKIASETPEKSGLVSTTNINVSDNLTTIKNIDGFFDLLNKSVQDGVTSYKQDPTKYEYSNVVRAMQIGLEFLGFDLPRYGSDGLFGPETENSVSRFKSTYQIDGPGNSFSPTDTTSLINILKEKNFGENELQKVWSKSYDLASLQIQDLGSLGSDMEFLLYMPHQQGPAGSIGLCLAYLGKGRLHPETRKNEGLYLRSNIWNEEYDLLNGIRLAIINDDDQRAAALFLGYQHKLWMEKKPSALEYIKLDKYAEVKKAIDSVDSFLPKEFLYTVAYIESGFKPESGRGKSRKYHGLYAMKPSSHQELVRILLPGETPDVYNPRQNARTAIFSMEQGIKEMLRGVGSDNLAQIGLTNIPNV